MKKIEAILFLFCLGANFLYMYANNVLNLIYILAAVALYLSSTAIHLIFHEIGHLAGGLVDGYKLVYLSIGPISLFCGRNKKIKLSIGKSSGGQCVMTPNKDMPCPYLGYNLGGVLSNLCVCLLAAALLSVDIHICTLLSIDLLFVGFQKLITNCVPSISNGYPNDAYIVKLLSRSEYTRKDYSMYLKLYCAIFCNEEIDRSEFEYERPLNVAQDELLYYKEIQALLSNSSEEKIEQL